MKFNNLRLALGIASKFYTSLTKGLKLKVREFWGLIPTFVEVTREGLVGQVGFLLHGPTPAPLHTHVSMKASFTTVVNCFQLFIILTKLSVLYVCFGLSYVS